MTDPDTAQPGVRALSRECMVDAHELCSGLVEMRRDGAEPWEDPLSVVPCGCTEGDHHQLAVGGGDPRRLHPPSRGERPEPFNAQPATAGLGEAPDWRGYPPTRERS